MRNSKRLVLFPCALLVLMLFSCGKETNPPRDEIPSIKDVLAELESAVGRRDTVAIKALLDDKAADLGCNSHSILSDVYPDSTEEAFYAFGRRNFYYTKNEAHVSCYVMSRSDDTGRAAEITLVKKHDRWLIRRFDLK